MTFCSLRSCGRNSGGFTLIELLTVIAIIGILAAITIPVVGGVRDSAKKTKTRVQFTEWTAAVRSFKNTYGYYPKFISSNPANHRVNGALAATDTTISDDDYLFRELLSGQGAKPKSGGGFEFYSDEKDADTAQNKRHTQFARFDIAEISSVAGGDLVDGAIKDAFGNVEIAVIVDRTGDGFIKANDLVGITSFPALKAAGERGTLTSAVIQKRIDDADPNKSGVRAEVIFYTPGKGASSGGPSEEIKPDAAVWSW